ncbi:MAG: tetratricopeptide repeat protein [Pseudanabaena sp.]|jgi:CHAT domain-containing protein
MTSRFYALTLVLATGLGGILLPPDQSFVNAQTQTTQTRKAEADRLLDLGTQQYKLSQFEPALQSWQQALVIYQEIKDRQKEGILHGNLGKTYESLGRYDQAIASHRQSLAIAKELGDRRGEGESLINLGVVYRALGNYSQAIAHHEQSLVITRETGNRRGEGSALGNLGMNYYAQGDYVKAIAFHEQRLAIALEIKDRQGEGNAMGNLGNAYRAQGNFAKAIEYQEKRLAITREIKEIRGEGQALGFLGLVYRSLGDYPKSISYYKQSLAIAIKINDRLSKAKSLGYLGNAYYDQGNYQEAIKYHQSSLEAAREISDRRGEGKSLGYLGNAYEAQGNYDEAIKYYESSLKIAREVNDRRGEGKTLGSMGSAYYALGNYTKAIDYHNAGLEIARKIKNRDGERMALNQIGLTLEKQKQTDLSIVFYKQSVNISESIRQDIRKLDRDLQNSYLSNVESSYRRLADLLLQQGRVMEALQVLDLLKVQELEDYLKNIKGSDRTAQGVRILEPEKAISDKLLAVSFENSPEINDLLAKQIQQLPQSEINKVPDYLQQIPQETVLLYPLILSDRLEIILFSPNTLPISRTVKISKDNLEALISNFRDGVRDVSSEDVKDPATALYTLLIKPIESELAQAKAQTILYAPDGQLRYVPLAALYNGKQWLVEKYRISNLIAYSLSDFSPQPKTQPSILAGAFGGREGEQKFGQVALPATLTEVKTIAKKFQNSVALTEDNFSRQAIESKLKNHNIIHLATHAEFNTGAPDNSFIIFGNGDKIRLHEITDWQIPNVDLIILSACQTGLGAFGSGVEILGFGYQVQKAGAKNAIASLWSVNDVGTGSLMTAFYAELQKENVAISESLRRSQIALIKSQDYNHPYFWSAFFAIGNGL